MMPEPRRFDLTVILVVGLPVIGFLAGAARYADRSATAADTIAVQNDLIEIQRRNLITLRELNAVQRQLIDHQRVKLGERDI